MALVKGVSAAAIRLEEDRTMSAADALKRANAEKTTLSKQNEIALKALRDAQIRSSVVVSSPASISAIKPDSINPSQARLDSPRALHHVMVRGIEKRRLDQKPGSYRQVSPGCRAERG